MSRSRARKMRPLPGAQISDQAGEPLPYTVQVPAPLVTVNDLAASYFVNCHAVLVLGKIARRRLYFSLHSAERAVERARARGDVASMVLVQLVPVQHLTLVSDRADV